MMKKKLFCTFFVFVILSGVAHGSHYTDLNESERHCCYSQREDDLTSDYIVCRVGYCEVSTKAVAGCGVFLACVGMIALAGVLYAYGPHGSNPDGPVFNSTSSTGMSSFAAIQPSKPSVAAMQRNSSFEQLHSQSNSTHVASLLKKNNKKKQS